MKKFTKIMSLMLAIMMVAVLFVGCGSGEGGNSIVGKWSYTEEAEGVKVELVYEFKANGDLKMASYVGGEEAASMEGTYKVEGSQIIVTIEGEEQDPTDFVVKGNKLTLTENDDEIVLTRK